MVDLFIVMVMVVNDVKQMGLPCKVSKVPVVVIISIHVHFKVLKVRRKDRYYAMIYAFTFRSVRIKQRDFGFRLFWRYTLFLKSIFNLIPFLMKEYLIFLLFFSFEFLLPLKFLFIFL